MNSMRLVELNNEQFYAFTNNHDCGSLYQATSYAFAMHEQDFESVFVGFIDENDTVVAASLILLEKLHGFKYAYAPRGFLIDYTNKSLLVKFTKELKKFLSKREVIAIKIAPPIIRNIYNSNELIYTNPNFEEILNNLKAIGYYHMGFNNFFEALKPRFESITDISRNYVDIFNSFNKETKTKIRSAVKKGVTIYKGKQENLEYLYGLTKNKYPRDLKYFNDMYYFFGKSNNIDFYYAKLDPQVFVKYAQEKYNNYEIESNHINDLIIKQSGKNRTHLINKKIMMDTLLNRAKKDLVISTNIYQQNPNGLIIASILVVKHKDEAYMIMDGFERKYKSFNAKHLLLWKAIEKYSNMGLKKFNLGGVTNPTLSNNDYQGLNDFKTSFDGKIHEYIGDFELITNNTLYFMYKNSAPLRSIIKK